MRARLLGIAVAGTILLGVALELGPRERALAVEAYVDLLCALALAGIAAAVGSAAPAGSQLARRRRPARAPERRPRQLEWLERQLGGGQTLRSLVVQIASAQLMRKHGVVLERDPARARTLVGERVWRVIDADGTDAAPRGHELELLVADLEAIT